MDISRINSSSAAAIQQARTEDSEEVRGREIAAEKRSDRSKIGDALDVQSAAKEAPELTAARAALRQIDTLDDARREEIKAKIASGFYSQPDTIAKVADSMADALQSGKSAE